MKVMDGIREKMAQRKLHFTLLDPDNVIITVPINVVNDHVGAGRP